MKIAILSDIHGNLPALQAVAEHIETWRPDRVVVSGDIVNRGPSSAACWDFIEVRQHSVGWRAMEWRAMYGNHEGYVLAYTRPDFDLSRLTPMSYWTLRQLNARVARLADLPETLSFSADGWEVRARHASMLGERDGIHQHTPNEQVRQQIAPAPTVFCTGHTHKPFIRQVDNTLVVNAGSVGTPCDDDTCASYAQVVWHKGHWQAEIIRVAYDREQTNRDMQTSGFLDTEPFALIIYHEWRTAHDMVIPYWQQYLARVQASEMDEAAAVRLFLSQNGLLSS